MVGVDFLFLVLLPSDGLSTSVHHVSEIRVSRSLDDSFQGEVCGLVLSRIRTDGLWDGVLASSLCFLILIIHPSMV